MAASAAEFTSVGALDLENVKEVKADDPKATEERLPGFRKTMMEASLKGIF